MALPGVRMTARSALGVGYGAFGGRCAHRALHRRIAYCGCDFSVLLGCSPACRYQKSLRSFYSATRWSSCECSHTDGPLTVATRRRMSRKHRYYLASRIPTSLSCVGSGPPFVCTANRFRSDMFRRCGGSTIVDRARRR